MQPIKKLKKQASMNLLRSKTQCLKMTKKCLILPEIVCDN